MQKEKLEFIGQLDTILADR